MQPQGYLQDQATYPRGYASPQGYASGEPQAADEDAALPDRLRKQIVSFDRSEPAGTIVIDTGNTYLYYVLGNGRAIRYGVGVGREGFTWAGVQTVSRKAEWPDWHPPAEMIARQPYLRASSPAVPAIRLARARCISVRANTASTAPTIPPRSASSCRPAAFV